MALDSEAKGDWYRGIGQGVLFENRDWQIVEFTTGLLSIYHLTCKDTGVCYPELKEYYCYSCKTPIPSHIITMYNLMDM